MCVYVCVHKHKNTQKLTHAHLNRMKQASKQKTKIHSGLLKKSEENQLLDNQSLRNQREPSGKLKFTVNS